MMFPLLVPMIGHVAAKSFAPPPRRLGRAVRHRLRVGVGLCGSDRDVAIIAARAGLSSLGLAAWAGLIGCALAAVWQFAPGKVRAVNRCHGTMALRPFGAAAARDAFSFGIVHGARCVRACLPAMALPLLGGLGLGAMAAIFAILLAERARHTPQYGLSAIALLLLGAVDFLA